MWKDTPPNGQDFWPYGSWAGALSLGVNFCFLEKNAHSAPQNTLQAKHCSRYQTSKQRQTKWERKNMCLDLQLLTSGETAKSFLPFILAHVSRCLWACFTLPLAMSHRADSGTHLQVQGEESVPVGAACFPPHIHGSGIFSMRLPPQLNITTVVHGKCSGAPFWQVQALLLLKAEVSNSYQLKLAPGCFYLHICAFWDSLNVEIVSY